MEGRIVALTQWSESPATSQEFFIPDDYSQDSYGNGAPAQDTYRTESATLPATSTHGTTAPYGAFHQHLVSNPVGCRHRQPPPAQVSRRLLCTGVPSFEDRGRQLAAGSKLVVEELDHTVDRNISADADQYNLGSAFFSGYLRIFNLRL
ncbi:hypothetical protein Y032_0773g2239 [Ancylostoma ceylanicum]|uniref:Uncharacterized protein n=1 Tax=Ancylostoma ceylanicum TaxID=53326 RepID=A0A016WDJ6_9BILA|nr:hypothetical protein Y032_0773g2239 [Ancylostoma ceylanicum]